MQRKQFVMPLIFLFFAIPLGSFSINKLPDQKLRLNFLDVGQGDATFVKTPGGNNLLIDGGPSRKVLASLGKKLSFWDRTFDYAILTHPDLDHYLGLIPVAKRYGVKKFIMNGDTKDHPAFHALMETLREEKIAVEFAKRDSRITLPDGSALDFLWPEDLTFERASRGANKRALVFTLTANSKKILFPADIDEEVEKALASLAPDVDVLKVAHHGSKTASTKKFLEKIRPEIAVISVGKNRYGHPHPQALKRLTEAGVQVYRTDTQGTVEVVF